MAHLSRVVLIYRRKDLQDPRNYWPIYVSSAIYNIPTCPIFLRITSAMTPGVLSI